MQVRANTAMSPPYFENTRRNAWIIAVLLACSAVFLVLFSQAKSFWNDEALTYYTIHHRSLLGVVRFQASTPLVLEPPTNDVILWCTSQVLGFSKQALRFSSLLFFLMVQWFLYRVTSLVGGFRAGFLAAAAVLVTQFVGYGAECRPYALIAMLTMAALLLWYMIRFRSADGGRRALGWAFLLALVIALAVTAQFLGAMIVFPIIVAEIVMCFAERRVPNRWVLFALGLGLASIVLDLPFLRAVRVYRPAVPFNVDLNPTTLAATYAWGFFNLPVRLVRTLGSNNGIWLALALAVLGSLPRRAHVLPGAGHARARAALWSGLVALTFIPIPILLIAHFVTHYFQPRYAVQSIPGLIALLAIGCARLTQRWNRPTLLAATGGGLLLLGLKAGHVIEAQVQQALVATAPYRDSQAAQMLIAANPKAPLYLSVDACILYPFYGDPAYTSRIRCLYSDGQEQRFNHTVLTSLTTRVLTSGTDVPFQASSFEAMEAQGNALLVYTPRPWLTWIAAAVKAEGAQYSYAGPGLGGEVFSVSFPDKK